VPAIAVAGEATTALLVGSRLFCVGYHHPVVLAKEAATLDVLSEGRFELGLGAGWLEPEYAAMGIPFAPAGERIRLLAETVELVRQCLAGGPVDVAGEHVRARDFSALPSPVRDGGPPVMIGGGGRKVLTLAGQLADIVSVNFDNSAGALGPDSFRSSTAERTARKIAWVREGAGERFDGLELEIGAYYVAVDGRTATTAEQLAARLGISVPELATFPHALTGSVDRICDVLEERRETYGLSYVTVGDAVADAFAPVVARLAGR
jgi:probable F420-dependent oxidoreductase